MYVSIMCIELYMLHSYAKRRATHACMGMHRLSRPL